MSYTKACCSIPAVSSNYAPVGSLEEIGNLSVYTVGPKDAKKAVLVIYDIFAMHTNTKQFCDILAQHCGWKVVMPDFFRGDDANDRMGDIPAMLEWLKKIGDIEVITPDIQRVEKHLREQGVDNAVLVGFCWGAKIAVQTTARSSFFAGASMIHPSFVDNKDAELANAPILAIPSKDEADMSEYMQILSKKPFGAECEHYRFDDMQHGFCAARGNFEDEENKKRATEAIQLTCNFFSKCFKAN
ncbi:Alpha/Beta hydrolase protein [Sporodiniella umbellata]|nr:Alpha/Beta hydrolase protein [Sporodiniella umbellata]